MIRSSSFQFPPGNSSSSWRRKRTIWPLEPSLGPFRSPLLLNRFSSSCPERLPPFAEGGAWPQVASSLRLFLKGEKVVSPPHSAHVCRQRLAEPREERSNWAGKRAVGGMRSQWTGPFLLLLHTLLHFSPAFRAELVPQGTVVSLEDLREGGRRGKKVFVFCLSLLQLHFRREKYETFCQSGLLRSCWAGSLMDNTWQLQDPKKKKPF